MHTDEGVYMYKRARLWPARPHHRPGWVYPEPSGALALREIFRARRYVLSRIVGLFLMAATITSATLAQETPPPSDALFERGMTAYKLNYCGACHALAAAGTNGAFGPTHDGMVATALQRLADPSYSGSATTAEEYLRESILDPTLYLVPGFVMTPHAMPSFAHLPTQDIDALIALLLAQ